MKSHQTRERPELSIGMLPLCPDWRQRLENPCRWRQSPSWLRQTTKLLPSKQTKAKLQHLYSLSESGSAVELQFLYPAVSESCFKTLRCTCHGQQIKHTAMPVAAQLAKLQQLSRWPSTSWVHKHSPKLICVHSIDIMQPVVMSTMCCCTHMGTHALSTVGEGWKGWKDHASSKEFWKCQRMKTETFTKILMNLYIIRGLGNIKFSFPKKPIVNYALEAFSNIIYTRNV